MNKRLHGVLLALSFCFVTPLSGCDKIAYWTGIGVEIEVAESGTPARVIQKAFEAALMDGESKGWNQFKKLIHPTKNKTRIQKNEWKDDRWSRLRRNISHYITTPGTASFRVMKEELREDGRLIIHVENSEGDVPTPCALKKDDVGRWKLWSCSL